VVHYGGSVEGGGHGEGNVHSGVIVGTI
jgi:hypothetical protein